MAIPAAERESSAISSGPFTPRTIRRAQCIGIGTTKSAPSSSSASPRCSNQQQRQCHRQRLGPRRFHAHDRPAQVSLVSAPAPRPPPTETSGLGNARSRVALATVPAGALQRKHQPPTGGDKLRRQSPHNAISSSAIADPSPPHMAHCDGYTSSNSTRDVRPQTLRHLGRAKSDWTFMMENPIFQFHPRPSYRPPIALHPPAPTDRP